MFISIINNNFDGTENSEAVDHILKSLLADKRGVLAAAKPGTPVWNGSAFVEWDDDVKTDLEAEIAEIERLLS